jgi:hypothetical protein
MAHLVADQEFDTAIVTLERYADGLAKEAERVKLARFDFSVKKGGTG